MMLFSWTCTCGARVPSFSSPFAMILNLQVSETFAMVTALAKLTTVSMQFYLLALSPLESVAAIQATRWVTRRRECVPPRHL